MHEHMQCMEQVHIENMYAYIDIWLIHHSLVLLDCMPAFPWAHFQSITLFLLSLSLPPDVFLPHRPLQFLQVHVTARPYVFAKAFGKNKVCTAYIYIYIYIYMYICNTTSFCAYLSMCSHTYIHLVTCATMRACIY
jgi:hypothetical protein